MADSVVALERPRRPSRPARSAHGVRPLPPRDEPWPLRRRVTPARDSRCAGVRPGARRRARGLPCATARRVLTAVRSRPPPPPSAVAHRGARRARAPATHRGRLRACLARARRAPARAHQSDGLAARRRRARGGPPATTAGCTPSVSQSLTRHAHRPNGLPGLRSPKGPLVPVSRRGYYSHSGWRSAAAGRCRASRRRRRTGPGARPPALAGGSGRSGRRRRVAPPRSHGRHPPRRRVTHARASGRSSSLNGP